MYRLIFTIVPIFSCQLIAAKATHLQKLCPPVTGMSDGPRQRITVTVIAPMVIQSNSFGVMLSRLSH